MKEKIVKGFEDLLSMNLLVSKMKDADINYLIDIAIKTAWQQKKK